MNLGWIGCQALAPRRREDLWHLSDSINYRFII